MQGQAKFSSTHKCADRAGCHINRFKRKRAPPSPESSIEEENAEQEEAEEQEQSADSQSDSSPSRSSNSSDESSVKALTFDDARVDTPFTRHNVHISTLHSDDKVKYIMEEIANYVKRFTLSPAEKELLAAAFQKSIANAVE